jgi:hypothetical protein
VKVLDKTKSYKIRGGKLVERTAEELARLERLKAERECTHKPAKGRMPRAEGRFVITTATQAEKLIGLEHVCWPLFTILSFENFRHRRAAFALPTSKLNTLKGLSPRNLRRALIQMETCGLISVVRNPPRPPLITVL